jgi:hypothetical protein
MSDIITDPNAAALATINARIAELNSEIAQHERLAGQAAAIRDAFADLAADLGRKPRVRKPRAVTETPRAANDEAEEAPRPTVFAVRGASVTGEAA